LTVGSAALRGSSVWAAMTAPATYVAFDRVAAHGLPYLRAAGSLLALAGIGWGLWIGRRVSDFSRVSAVAAFAVCSYALLATGVHEDHAFPAISRLVAASAGRRRFTAVLAAVSAWFTLNIVFYRITDDGRFDVPRWFTVIDATMVVVVVGCVWFAWFATVLCAECVARSSASPQAFQPARLERFRFSCSDAVAAMSDVVRALVGHEKPQGRRHQLADVVERARTRGAQERLQFGEGEFDGIEVGTVRREKSQPRARLLNRHADGGLFVGGEIVEHDDIARAQRGHQHLLDVGAEGVGVHRPIEHGRRGQLGGTERRHHRVGLPMAARRVIPHARPAQAARVAA
jgi:hypothetical protein